ncbi:MAG TPA: 4-hydroxy-tetrahydrodipicolinate reductase [Ktedonobacterales bacterium]
MTIRVCVAGATGWAGSAVTRAILLAPDEFTLTGAVARKRAGEDIGVALGLAPAGVTIAPTVAEALRTPTDVLIDYTSYEAVKANALAALEMGVRVVAGSSGLTAIDYEEIGRIASERGLAVIAAGNFSITAALAKRFSLIAARYLPSWELIDYAQADKADAPSGTVRELAEELGQVRQPHIEVPIERTHGEVAARGADIAGMRVHSVRLPSYVIAFEAIFGQPSERLTIRHDAGVDAGPYVAGTLLAARRVMDVAGLVRGLDRLMLDN